MQGWKKAACKSRPAFQDLGSKYVSKKTETFKMKPSLAKPSRLLQHAAFLILFVIKIIAFIVGFYYMAYKINK